MSEPLSKLIQPVRDMLYVRKIARDAMVAYTDWLDEQGVIDWDHVPESELGLIDQFIETDEYRKVVP